NDFIAKVEGYQNLLRFGFAGPRPSIASYHYRCKALQSKSVEVRKEAINYLFLNKRKWSGTLPLLISALSDPEKEVRYEVKAALQFFGPEVVASLQKAVKHPDPLVRAGAIEVMARLGKKARPAFEDVFAVVDDKDPRVRLSVSDYLSSVNPRDKRVMPTFIRQLKDLDRAVRLAAIRSMEIYGTQARQAIPELLKGFKGTDMDVRSFCARSLGTVGKGNKAVLQALMAGLKYKDNLYSRCCAAETIGALGIEAKEAV